MSMWTLWSNSPVPLDKYLSEQAAKERVDELTRMGHSGIFAESEEGETYPNV